MNTRPAIALILALTVGAMGATAAEDDMAGNENPSMGAAGLITVGATVTEIDPESREVTLKGEDGEAFMISVGNEVKNLDQVKPGDHVEVAYYESVTVEVLGTGSGASEVAASETLDTAKPGEKPGALATSKMSVVATVKGIDKENGTVTLAGPEGEKRTVKVINPENLEKVAVGDNIRITFTRAVAVAVTGASTGDMGSE